MKRALLIFTLLIINISTIFHFGNGRSMKNDISALASDRDDYDGLLAPSTRSDAVGTTTVTCEAMYGFLPCSTTLLGLLFLIVVYEVLLSFGERYVSAGSDLFFETFGTGVVGSSIFHLFGTIPQVGLILGNYLSPSILLFNLFRANFGIALLSYLCFLIHLEDFLNLNLYSCCGLVS